MISEATSEGVTMAQGESRRDGAVDKNQPTTTAAKVDYEAELWQMADALRGTMDAAEYKHVVLGLIFLQVRLRRFRRAASQARR
jgi:hypothetical protein